MPLETVTQDMFLNAIKNFDMNALQDQYVWARAQGHPLVKDWFLLSSPVPMLCLVAAYLSFVLIVPRIMKNRQPFELKYFSILHNLFLILLSAYMCGEAIRQALLNDYSLFCNATGNSEGMASVVWIFYLSKVPEFLDTVIMILRKKDKQVSFLHVYHHTTIFIIWHIVVYYAPGGDAYFSAAQNSFIHVIMYSYYLFVLLRKDYPDLKFPLPKAVITQLQMIQFLLNMIQGLASIYGPGCYNVYPSWLCYLLVYYMITLLILFGNFYIKAYNKAAADKKEKKAKEGKKEDKKEK